MKFTNNFQGGWGFPQQDGSIKRSYCPILNFERIFTFDII